MKSLVVFYSRTGTTKRVAEAISGILKCDLEEVFDTKNRSGILGYLASGMDAFFKKPAAIKETEKDPALYDVVVIGTPIWFYTISSPVRTYLSQNRERFKRVAFFCTCGGSSRNTFREMEELCGKQPLSLLEVKAEEVSKGECMEKVKKFIDEISS